MTSDLPAPLTTTEIDLKGFPGFVLDVERLLASELVALGTAEEISAALMLWCRAWQQNPPGSLPNDDRILAAFSKAKNWKKVREMALRGFIICSDGRMYHSFVCQQVLDAWDKRKAYRDKRDKEAERLREWREKKQAVSAHQVPDETRFNELGNALGNDCETRFKVSTKLVRREGEGKEKGREVNLKPSVPIGTGAEAPPGLLPNEALFQIAVPWLVANGCKESSVRSLLGGAIKQIGPEAAWELASDCMREKRMEPIAWLAGGLNDRIKLKAGGKDDKYRVAGLDHSSSQAAMAASMKRHGIADPGDEEILL